VSLVKGFSEQVRIVAIARKDRRNQLKLRSATPGTESVDNLAFSFSFEHKALDN
jgi:hypothetical protein